MLLSDEKLYCQLSKDALKLAEEMDWDKQASDILKKLRIFLID
ncbi:MAG: hypothetical protein QXP36_08545 [Conexivisphaerales archaeon]